MTPLKQAFKTVADYLSDMPDYVLSGIVEYDELWLFGLQGKKDANEVIDGYAPVVYKNDGHADWVGSLYGINPPLKRKDVPDEVFRHLQNEYASGKL